MDRTKTSQGLVAGIAVLAGIVGILLLGLTFDLFRRYYGRRRAIPPSNSTIDPMPITIGSSLPSSYGSHSEREGGGSSSGGRVFVKSGISRTPEVPDRSVGSNTSTMVNSVRPMSVKSEAPPAYHLRV